MTIEEKVIKKAQEFGLTADVRKDSYQNRYTVFINIGTSERLRFDGLRKATIFLDGVRVGRGLTRSV